MNKCGVCPLEPLFPHRFLVYFWYTLPQMKLFNSLGKKLEQFKPLNPKRAAVYVCGITPYDTTHLGHAFTYISFDALIRYLKYRGFKVQYSQNVTDINDRDKDILERAKQQNISWRKLASFWTKKFLKDMKALNWTPPTHYLKASQNLPFMINLIKKLLKNDLAYETPLGIFLDTEKFPKFGRLSGFSKAKMVKIAKDFEEDLENPCKKHPLDITLWRSKSESSYPHIPSFSSPFGRGRPGWHIECSAMSMEYLGEQIDIHGGGIDLIFPHHEAEIAQSEGATGKVPFVNYWLHTGQVYFGGAKMSKSKGNLVMVSDLLKKYSPNAIRWLILSRHWSKKWEFRKEDLAKAQKNANFAEKISGSAEMPWEKEFQKIMGNNLDTPKALKLLLKLSKQNAKGALQIFKILGFK